MVKLKSISKSILVRQMDKRTVAMSVSKTCCHMAAGQQVLLF